MNYTENLDHWTEILHELDSSLDPQIVHYINQLQVNQQGPACILLTETVNVQSCILCIPA
jgi:hypothetical protein